MNVVEQGKSSELGSFENPQWGGRQLKKISLFEYFDESELVELYKIGEFVVFNDNNSIVIEAENSRGLFIILQGKASVYKTDRQNNNMIRLAYLENGDAFGELSLFDDAPRSATVISETKCHLFHLPESEFSRFLEERGDHLKMRFYKKCAEVMVKRFRVQNDDYIVSQKLLWKYALRKKDSE